MDSSNGFDQWTCVVKFGRGGSGIASFAHSGNRRGIRESSERSYKEDHRSYSCVENNGMPLVSKRRITLCGWRFLIIIACWLQLLGKNVVFSQMHENKMA